MIDQLIQMIKSVSVGLKRSDAQTSQALSAIYQIGHKGYLAYEELIQLSEHLPGLVPALCQHLHITSSELTYRLEQGEIPAEEAFVELNSTIRNQFFIYLPNG